MRGTVFSISVDESTMRLRTEIGRSDLEFPDLYPPDAPDE
jgi:hypothetical protein